MSAKATPRVKEDRQQGVIRIHQVHTPALQRSALYLVATAFGVLVAYLISCLLFMALFMVMRKYLGFPSDSTGFAISLFTATLGPVLWIWFMSRPPYKSSARFRLRGQRLTAVQRHPQGTNRLPHRILEAEWHRKHQVASATAAKLRLCPPVSVILTDFPAPGEAIPVITADRTFEPVDITDGTELMRLFEVAMADLLRKADDEPPAADTDHSVPWWRFILGNLRSCLAQLSAVAALLVWPGYMFYRAWASAGMERAFYLAVVLALVGIPVLAGLLVERRWWLVPGGLVYRENRLWRKKAELKLFTPATTPLLLCWRVQKGFVVDGAKVRPFRCSELAAWVAVAVWLSRARTPTLAELQTLLASGRPRA